MASYEIVKNMAYYLVYNGDSHLKMTDRLIFFNAEL
jgi:hypothetical protein